MVGVSADLAGAQDVALADLVQTVQVSVRAGAHGDILQGKDLLGTYDMVGLHNLTNSTMAIVERSRSVWS